MTVKQIAIECIQGLPDTATWEDIKERIDFIAGIRRGLNELDNEKGINHNLVMEEFKKWLSD